MMSPMKVVVSRRDTCRLCGGQYPELVMQLAPTPLANAFVAHECLGEVQETYPLDLFLCHGCGHLQLLDVVDPEVLFRNYIYVSSTSPVSSSTSGYTRIKCSYAWCRPPVR